MPRVALWQVLPTPGEKEKLGQVCGRMTGKSPEVAKALVGNIWKYDIIWPCKEGQHHRHSSNSYMYVIKGERKRDQHLKSITRLKLDSTKSMQPLKEIHSFPALESSICLASQSARTICKVAQLCIDLTSLVRGFALTVMAHTLHIRQTFSAFWSNASWRLRSFCWQVATVFREVLSEALRGIAWIVTNYHARIALNLPTNLTKCGTHLSKSETRTGIANSTGSKAWDRREIATRFWKTLEPFWTKTSVRLTRQVWLTNWCVSTLAFQRAAFWSALPQAVACIQTCSDDNAFQGTEWTDANRWKSFQNSILTL